MVHILADTFFQRHDHVLTAALSVVVALIAAGLVDRAITRALRHRRIAAGTADPRLDTRLRFLRRVLGAAIVVIGIAVALAQFTALDRLAASVLASGAIAAAVIGFAARQTLANAVAGLLLAVTQPLRIGDVVTFEGETGVVEDVRLTYTYLRDAGGARIVVPNERLAAGVLRNDTITGPTVSATASVWLAHDADVEEAIGALQEAIGDCEASVAEITPEGVRLTVSVPGVQATERGAREAGLRRDALAALRRANVPRPSGGGPTRGG